MSKIEEHFKILRACLSRLDIAVSAARDNLEDTRRIVAEMEASLMEVEHVSAPTEILEIEKRIENLAHGKGTD